MAVTATLLKATPHRLVYGITSDGAGGTVLIDSSGGATPDLATDVASITGPMKRIGRAGLDGIGLIAAGGFDVQAKSDALLLSAEPANLLGNSTVPRATTRCQGQTIDDEWIVTTAVAAGNPQLSITHGAAAATAIVVIETPHSTAL